MNSIGDDDISRNTVRGAVVVEGLKQKTNDFHYVIDLQL